MATFIAYGCGKRNHDFTLRTEDYKSVFEANLVKGRIFSASDYEFVNCKTSKKELHKVGKVVTKSSGNDNTAIRTVTDSYFKIDKVNVFDLLREKGYFLKMSGKGLLKSEVSLYTNSNKEVATLKLNEKGPRQENVSGIGNTQRNTVITTELDDLEVIFLAAFIMSKVEVSTRLL